MKKARCKICRRLGISVCGKEKCALRKKPYPPGQQTQKKVRALSEYGKELLEKQKLKNIYNLREKQFKKIIKEVFAFQKNKGKDASKLLFQLLERRLDNVVFRLGWSSTRRSARQLVSHGHFLVNGKPVNIPSYLLKKGDVIKVKEKSVKKKIFQNLLPKLRKQNVVPWLSLDVDNFEAKVIAEPEYERIAPPVEISSIFEYYSR